MSKMNQKPDRLVCSCLQEVQAKAHLAEELFVIVSPQIQSPKDETAVGASNVSHQDNILVTLQHSAA